MLKRRLFDCISAVWNDIRPHMLLIVQCETTVWFIYIYIMYVFLYVYKMLDCLDTVL